MVCYYCCYYCDKKLLMCLAIKTKLNICLLINLDKPYHLPNTMAAAHQGTVSVDSCKLYKYTTTIITT